MKALPLMVEKLWYILNFKICRSKVTFKVTRSKCWYEWQGLIIRNVHVKYESPTFYGSNVMVKVKVFVTDRRTEGQRKRGTKTYMHNNGYDLRIWSILLIKSDLKLCKHFCRSVFLNTYIQVLVAFKPDHTS